MGVGQAFAAAAVGDLISLVVLLLWLHRRRRERFPSGALLPGVAAVLVAVPAYFLAMMIGGQYGLLAGGAVTTSLHLPRSYTMIGVCLAMWVFFTVVAAALIECVGLLVLSDRR